MRTLGWRRPTSYKGLWDLRKNWEWLPHSHDHSIYNTHFQILLWINESKPNRVYGNLRSWYVMTTMIFCCMSLQAGHVISVQALGQNINTGNGWNTSDYINTCADQTTICNGDTRRCCWGTQWPLSCVFSSIIRSTNAKKPSVYTFAHTMFYI